jgi:hypothetical protein
VDTRRAGRGAPRVNTAKGRVKDRHMRRDPSVAIEIVNPENPYHWVTVYGRVDEVVEESDPDRGSLATESIDAPALLYVNRHPYPFREEAEVRVLHYVRPDQVVTFGAP